VASKDVAWIRLTLPIESLAESLNGIATGSPLADEASSNPFVNSLRPSSSYSQSSFL
jgi:hypothetical protein